MKRPRSHRIEAESLRFVQNVFEREPFCWHAREVGARDDYGHDLEVELADLDELTGKIFRVQVKATDFVKIRQKDNVILFEVYTNHLKRWFEISLSMPMLLILYDSKNECAYYKNIGKWVQKKILKIGGIKFLEKQKSYTITIDPEDNLENSLKRIQILVSDHFEKLKFLFSPSIDPYSSQKPKLKSETTAIKNRTRFEISKKITIRKKLDRLNIRDQGERDTAVAFAVLGAIEVMLQCKMISLRLSPQHLYYKCKTIDNYKNIDGTWVDCALQIMNNYGVCLDQDWPYNPKLNPKNLAQGPEPKNLPIAAKITGYHAFNPTDIDFAHYLLDRNIPLIATIPAYRSWLQYNSWVEKTGEINLPLPADLEKGLLGYHVICIVDYNKADQSFIFKNSWGKKWAENGSYGPGIGQLPWSYIAQYATEIHFIENVFLNINVSDPGSR